LTLVDEFETALAVSAARYATLRHALHPAALRVRRWRRPYLLHLLGRTSPLSDHSGVERGTPVDRHHIEQFLSAHACDLRGRALELESNRYPSPVRERGLLRHRGPLRGCRGHDRDHLATDTLIPTGADVCANVTQVLHDVYDVRAAVRNLHRVLKPGGTLLVTVPAVRRILVDVDPAGELPYNDLLALHGRLVLVTGTSPGPTAPRCTATATS